MTDGGKEKDGVWCLGTGSPRLDGDRMGAGTVFAHGGRAMLIDCGIGALHRLTQLDMGADRVDAVFVTHHHVDHVADLPALVMVRWIASRRGRLPPLTVYGPPGTRRFVDATLASYAVDIESRRALGLLDGAVMPGVVEVADGVRVTVGPWTVTAFDVDHQPIAEALGYQVERDRVRMVVSGDTRPCSSLAARARGADLLLHEALYPGYGQASYHTGVEDVGRLAARVGVRRLLLTHLIPGTLPDGTWLGGVRQHYSGPVVVARDLLQLADWSAPGGDPFASVPCWVEAVRNCTALNRTEANGSERG